MTKFEDVKVTGGPHGKNLEVWVGGEQITGLSHAELVFDVNDVVRLKTTKFVQADYEGPAEFIPKVTVRVNDRRFIEGDGWRGEWSVVAESTADTIWEALYDCARQLELAARRDGQGVAHAGTIMPLSGRPPGH